MRPTQQDSHHDRDIWELARTVWTEKKEIGLQRWEIVCTGAVWAVSRYSGPVNILQSTRRNQWEAREERGQWLETGDILCSVAAWPGLLAHCMGPAWCSWKCQVGGSLNHNHNQQNISMIFDSQGSESLINSDSCSQWGTLLYWRSWTPICVFEIYHN